MSDSRMKVASARHKQGAFAAIGRLNSHFRALVIEIHHAPATARQQQMIFDTRQCHERQHPQRTTIAHDAIFGRSGEG